VNVDARPVALALLAAKEESLSPGHGLDRAEGCAECRRHKVRFVFSSDGHRFAEFDFFSRRYSQGAEVDAAAFGLKAENPNRRRVVDERKREELIAIIEEKGREIAAALAELKG
jgi:hypothetical protein